MRPRLALATCLLLAMPAAAGAHQYVPPPVDGVAAKREARSDLARAAAAAPAALADSWCPTDPARSTDDTANEVSKLPDVKVIYAYPSDRPNNFLRYANEIQKSMKDMSGLVAAAPGSSKGIRFDVGTPCGPQYLDIQTVRLTKTHAQLFAMDALAVASDLGIFGGLREAGVLPADHPRNYIVFLDGTYNGSAAGVAPNPGDARPGPENFLNDGGRIAITFGWDDPDAPYSWYGDVNEAIRPWLKIHVPLHELLHSIGAVLNPAPHATGAGHCFDEWDIVCSNDGATYGSNLTTTCGPDDGNLEIDCGDDDYFRPAGGLVDRFGQPMWNTYDSVFLCRTDRCVNAPPSPAFVVEVTQDGAIFNGAGSTDDDGVARYEWDLDGDGSFETDSGRSPIASRTFGTLGEHTASLRATDTDGIARTSTLRFAVAVASGGGGGGVTAARIGSLSLSPKKFRVPRSTRGRAATVRFAIDKGAKVTFAVEKATTGRRSGRRCVKQTRRNRKARKCTRYVRVPGTLQRDAGAGTNSFAWNGRLGRTKLGAAKYRMSATPAGGTARVAAFTVKR